MTGEVEEEIRRVVYRSQKWDSGNLCTRGELVNVKTDDAIDSSFMKTCSQPLVSVRIPFNPSKKNSTENWCARMTFVPRMRKKEIGNSIEDFFAKFLPSG